MTTGPDVSAAFASVVVDEWGRAGVTDAVVAPGSRSTPLLVALAADGRLRIHVVLDERSAGFVALGFGLATGRPAPVVTTSGTAAVELHPAIVEADQAAIPLIAVTADRPPELHHVGASQTVEQADLYGASTRWTVIPGVADLEASGSWRSLASRTVAAASGAGSPGGRPGPVHLNVAFREPLLGAAAELPPGRPGGGPWHRVTTAAALPANATVELIASHQGRHGLFVAGAGAGDPPVVAALADRLGWPVLADPRSGLRIPAARTVAAADAVLRVPSVATLAPDIVVRLGRPWASKVVNQWLDALPVSVPQVLVDPHAAWIDPGRQSAHVAGAEPTALAAAVLGALGPSHPPPSTAGPSWAGRWAELESAAQAAIDTTLAATDVLSEPALARRLLAEVAAGTVVVCSSSMPVRDVEWWSRSRLGVRVVANRGANGIDGVVSTAIGVALGSGAPTVALVGDLAFLYDAGALLWASERSVDLTIVVADNNGGGIFSFLPQAAAVAPDTFERYWGTPHGLDLTAVAGAYGVATQRVGDLDELAGALRGGPGIRLVVVRTDRAANVAVHARLHVAVATAIGTIET
ncbi:MAG: 2-succinyl-5-enolpyruvyl-6-hydroxy-3-cyclohexene-1-carboxylic-acid synthase [Actinomycetota bacterium]|nr:2-succinyl-5-enolpyruvyl-6-hydroxy-3-cyclohexene-1-carboxylic-acid synthase [Actinomycetota bacterium]